MTSHMQAAPLRHIVILFVVAIAALAMVASAASAADDPPRQAVLDTGQFEQVWLKSDAAPSAFISRPFWPATFDQVRAVTAPPAGA